MSSLWAKTPSMRHTFSGDPWGPCSRCAHPRHHEIHWTAEDEAEYQAAVAHLERARLLPGEPKETGE